MASLSTSMASPDKNCSIFPDDSCRRKPTTACCCCCCCEAAGTTRLPTVLVNVVLGCCCCGSIIMWLRIFLTVAVVDDGGSDSSWGDTEHSRPRFPTEGGLVPGVILPGCSVAMVASDFCMAGYRATQCGGCCSSVAKDDGGSSSIDIEWGCCVMEDGQLERSFRRGVLGAFEYVPIAANICRKSAALYVLSTVSKKRGGSTKVPNNGDAWCAVVVGLRLSTKQTPRVYIVVNIPA